MAAPTDLSLETMELQWRAYVERLREGGALSSALAIADVSGSMEGEPMLVSTICLIRVLLNSS